MPPLSTASIALMEPSMITVSKCRELADYYKARSQLSSIPRDQAFLLKNIARSFTGVSGQLDRLAELMRKEGQERPVGLAKLTQIGPRPPA
jgi:hypothetical protein